MEIDLFTEFHILEQKKFLLIHVSKKLAIFSCLKTTDLYLEKINNLNQNNKNIRKENNNIEKVHSENEEDADNSYDKYKPDLSIITDGFCS
jgi:thymidylate synthase